MPTPIVSGLVPTTRTLRRPAFRNARNAEARAQREQCLRPPFAEPVETRGADQVEALRIGDDRRVLAVRERPGERSVPRVERIGPARQRREVDPPRDDRRRPGDRAVGLELPQNVAGRRVEAEEGVRVGADVDARAPDRGGGIDIAPGRLRPAQLAARCAERIHLAVGRTDVNPPVGERRRRVEVAGAAEARLHARLPDDLAARRVQRVEMPRVVADIETVAGDRDTALHLRVKRGHPPRLSRAPAQSPDTTVPIADEDRRTDNDRRRLGRADDVPPEDAARADCKRNHLAGERATRLPVARRRVEERLVDDMAVECR